VLVIPGQTVFQRVIPIVGLFAVHEVRITEKSIAGVATKENMKSPRAKLELASSATLCNGCWARRVQECTNMGRRLCQGMIA